MKAGLLSMMTGFAKRKPGGSVLMGRNKSILTVTFLFIATLPLISPVIAADKTALKSAGSDSDKGGLILKPQALSAVLAHGPWPPTLKKDLSNRVSGNEAAISFGRQLFFSPLLSGSQKDSCASCHSPQQAFASGPAVSNSEDHGLERNTQTLINARFNRWFGWDGRSDNLWAQSIRPITRAKEMNLKPEKIRGVVQHDVFSKQYSALFGDATQQTDELILVNVTKALAAYQETLVSGKTAFDRFYDAVERQDWKAAAGYPIEAQRGFLMFAGKGRCIFCHSGALFSNGEFHDAGVPYFIQPGVVDAGRHQGIIELQQSPFTLDGDYTDDPKKRGAWAVRKVARLHANFGAFRVPSLRNVAKTAPYMHNGSLATLEAVIDHYSNIDMERLHIDGEAILKPLKLTSREIADLVAFLESLSDDS